MERKQNQQSEQSYVWPPRFVESQFLIAPRMTHDEIVALNHAALAILVRGQWTPRYPPSTMGDDVEAMRLHEEETVLVDIDQLVPSRTVSPARVQPYADSILVWERMKPTRNLCVVETRILCGKPDEDCARSSGGTFCRHGR